MKLRGLFTLLVGALLLGVGCTTDADIDNIGSNGEGTTNVNISATLPELGGTTRGVDSARGGVANIDWDTYELRVIVKAYGTGDYAGKLAAEKVEYKVAETDANGNYQPISINLNIPLTSGHTYDIYLWADYVLKSAPASDLHYNTESFPAITLKGDNPLVINDETRDAFFGRGRAIVGDVATTWDEAFGVERAVAKLRMIATDAAGASATSATLQVEKLYTGFNIATGAPTSPTEAAVVSEKTAFETYSAETPAEGATEYSKSFITAYMLWPAEESVAIVGSFYEGDNTTPVSEVAPVAPIPFKRGSLTTLRGEMFDTGWDGTSTTEPMTTDGEWLIINNAEELAWVLENESTKGKSKVRLADDMDMGGYPVNPFPASIVEFDGNGKTISNVVVNGKSLFTEPYEPDEPETLKIYNLIIDNVTISKSGHVGVLFSVLYDYNAEFRNVTIKNSSATTTGGVAGGVVGYIGGGINYHPVVQFFNCDLENVKADGTLAEGKFVGRMHGYNNEEILSFDADCSADDNCAVADYASPYTEDNDAQWLDEGETAFDFSKYNGWLGDEEMYRATVKFDDHRMQIKWDGVTERTPITDDNGAYLIYSPFDLASLQKQSPSSVKFKTNVDLGGDHATEKNKFNPIKTITNLDGEEHTLYNLYVDMVHDGTGAAFIQTSSGTTTHKNLTFIDAYIKNVHNTNIPTPAYGVTNDGGAGNAYAGTLVSHTGGDYTAENVHFKNGTVYAVCKMGGAIGYVGSTNFTMTNCSVDGYVVENYKPGVPNYYTLPRRYTLNLSSVQSMSGITSLFGVGKIPSTAEVNCLQWWYTNGECGGLIGFIKSKTATIDHCSVTNTEINCVGQDNKPVVANVWDSADFNINDPYRSGVMIFAKGNTDVAGRHVNQFIGDVVSERKEGGSDYNITVSDYTVSGNSYNGIQATSTNKYSHNYASGKYCEVVGCAYYIGVDVKLFGIDLTHVNDCAGTLTFNALNSASVTITEEVKQGNSISWTGGSFTDEEYKQKNSGSFFRPKWSYNVESYYPGNPE